MGAVLSKYGEYFLTLMALGLLFGPVICYLISGWVARRREILGSFVPETIKLYFNIFYFADFGDSQNPQDDFRNLYDWRYSRQHFGIPSVCLFATSIFFLAFASSTIFGWLRGEAAPESDPVAIAVAAIAGAYMWVLYDLIRRAQQRDLHPPNLLRASFRLIVAAPLGYAIGALLDKSAAVPVAVLLGAFPTKTLFTIARRIASSRLSLGDPRREPAHELELLQGVERAQAERFEDEGVVTILQLAYSDPIDLTIRTNFSFSYVVDCCSQALAWLYFQQDLAKMRRFGLQGGQEIYNLISEIEGDYGDELQKQAEKCRNLAAADLKMDPQAFERSLREVAGDPYTEFLCDVWCASTENEQASDTG